MATTESSVKQTSGIRIRINELDQRINISHSSTAADLRTILSDRYNISSDIHFLDSEGCHLHIDDEESTTISELVIKNNFVRLSTDKRETDPIPIPEMKSNAFKRKDEQKFAQVLSQSSTRTPRPEIKRPDSTPTDLENKVILAADLDIDMLKRIFVYCNLLRGIKMDTEKIEHSSEHLFRFREYIKDRSWVRVNDRAYDEIYEKDKEMQSSFVSSKFFDGGIELSSSMIGFGINAEYLKSKAVTKTQRKIYLTYCRNYSRAILTLKSSYLEPTPQFIEAIDNVLSTISRDEQIIKLQEVLSTYGHVFPRQVVVGGHVHHKEVEIYAGSGFDKQSEEKSTEQQSLLTFEAVGGDTRLNHDPARWANTIGDPSLWRPIEQDDFQPVLTVLDKPRQEKVQNIINYQTMKEINANNNRQWKQRAITIVGRNDIEKKFNPYNLLVTIVKKHLVRPSRLDLFLDPIFIDKNDQSIFHFDRRNCRIIESISDEENCGIVACGNLINESVTPTDMIYNKPNNSFIISDFQNNRIIRWFRQNDRDGEIIINNITCYGIAIDKNGYIFISDWKKNEVRRWQIGDEKGTLVAGGNGKGDNFNQLNYPTYIFIDENESLYVSDRNNHRVMKWTKGANKGILVAGGNGKGNSLKQLSFPEGVIVDQFGLIYIADCGNDRVVRWSEGNEGTIVVGGNGKGDLSNQLNGPKGLSFDRQNNLYVVDHRNRRVQKFLNTSN